MDHYIEIAVYPKRFDAELACARLKAHRVDAMVVMSGNSARGRAKLYVNRRDEKTASALLKTAYN